MEPGMRHPVRTIVSVFLLASLVSCSDPLTARQKTAGVGSVIGADVGAGIGSTFGYAYTGGVAGAILGLCVGALVGGQAEALEKQQKDLEQKIQQCDRDIQHKSEKLDELKRELEEEQR